VRCEPAGYLSRAAVRYSTRDKNPPASCLRNKLAQLARPQYRAGYRRAKEPVAGTQLNNALRSSERALKILKS
jgi:hypothetical protein